MVRTKVFVGNLSFKTREPELAAAFQGAGKVVSANIITRGPRSLGYGFVEFESEEEAQVAVTQMHKQKIDERDINVEVAKPREDTLEDRPPPRARRPRTFRSSFRREGDNAEAHDNGGAQGGPTGQTGAGQQQGEGSDGTQRPFRRRVRRRFPRADGQPAQGSDIDGHPVQGQAKPQGQGQGRGQGQPSDQPPRERRPPRPRPPRPDQRPPPQHDNPRNPSKTTLFVANLPFAVDDTGLAAIFTNLSVKSAHVVRKRNGRSKGFGFVEFDTEDAQAKAKNAIDKKKVDDRELIVKVALTENKDGAEHQPETKEDKKPEEKAQ